MWNYFKQFALSTHGGVSMIFAGVLVVMLLFVGSAVDFSQLFYKKTDIQGTLDAAVIAGVAASLDKQDQIDAAEAFFNETVDGDFKYDRLTFRHDDDVLIGTLIINQSTSFLRLMKLDEIGIKVESGATPFGRNRILRCIHALDASSSSTLILNSKPRSSDIYTGASLIAADCSVQVDSPSPAAVVLKAGSFQSGRNCFVGGFNGRTGGLSPKPEMPCQPIGDPFSGRNIPVPAGCDYTDGSYGGGFNVTLSPGVYCGGLSAKGNKIKLKKGVYYVKGGPLELSADDEIYGDGVSFLVESFMLEANAVNLKAADTGSLASFIFYVQDNNSGNAPAIIKKKKKKKKKAKDNIIRAEEYVYLEGITYAPSQHVELRWRRPATLTSGYWSAPRSPFTSFIAKTLDFHGYSQLRFEYDPDRTDLSIPGELFEKIYQPRLTN